MRYLFFLCILTFAAFSVSGQTKTLTNADLTKYRVQREKGEREYRENYAKLGFPSPEELAKRREESAAVYREFAAKLRAENAEAERIESERRANRRVYLPQYYIVNTQPDYGDLDYVYYGGRYYPRPPRQQYTQPGYYAGGQFWPTGSATPVRPLWIPRR